jgi:hypothetical protein
MSRRDGNTWCRLQHQLEGGVAVQTRFCIAYTGCAWCAVAEAGVAVGGGTVQGRPVLLLLQAAM